MNPRFVKSISIKSTICRRALTAAGLLCCLLSVPIPMFGQFQGPPVTTPVSPGLTGPTPGVHAPTVTKTVANTALAPLVAYPGDTLEISVTGIATLTPLHPQVDVSGNITLPYVGAVHIVGLQVGEIQDLIARKFREGDYILNAQVNVQIVSSPSQIISVTGEVKSPGIVPAIGDRRLLDVIAAVGGLTTNASHLITVNHKATGETVQVLLDSNPTDSSEVNIALYAGDNVIVPRNGQIYVIGSIKSSAALPLITNTPFTLTQAIAASGGANFEAAMSRVRIIRTEGSERKAIAVDFKRVLDGKAADPILQADDIIYVPANLVKGALKSGGASLLVSSILGFAVLSK
jgi:polysaccharide biosynthesis/export protein